MIETIRKSSYLLERENGEIISVTYYGTKIKLNQVVVSNGRIFVAQGTKGVVKKIRIPFTGGRTSDILEVLFEGRNSIEFMKFKDLEL